MKCRWVNGLTAEIHALGWQDQPYPSVNWCLLELLSRSSLHCTAFVGATLWLLRHQSHIVLVAAISWFVAVPDMLRDKSG